MRGRIAACASCRHRGLDCADLAPSAFDGPPQLAFDGAGAGENSAVQFLEPVVGGIENEAARDAHGDAHGAAVELDCKTLRDHWTLLLASERGARTCRALPNCSLSNKEDALAPKRCAAHLEKPQARPPQAEVRNARGVRVVPCCCLDAVAAAGTENTQS